MPSIPLGRNLEGVVPKLEAVLAVGVSSAGGDHPFARADGGGLSDDRHEIALAAGVDLQDAEAGLEAVERHALDRADERLLERTALPLGMPRMP